MAITNEERHRLYTKLQQILGHEEAAVLMEHLPPVGWADVATKRDLDHLKVWTRAELSELRADITEKLRTQLLALAGLNLTTAAAVVAAVKL